jgi:hypothetical protein
MKNHHNRRLLDCAPRLSIGVLVLSTVMLTHLSDARAQGTAAAAETLFQQGRDEMAKGNYESACAKLRQSDELDPALGTKLNLADCESKRGNLATAWELFKAAEEKLDASDARYAIAKQKRQALEPQLPKLVIVLAQGAPSDTTVREGNANLGSSAFGIELPLDPGKHELLVSAPGRGGMVYTVVLEAGKTVKLEVAPGAASSAAQAPTTQTTVGSPGAAPVPPQPPVSGGGKTAGYVFGGIGVAGLLVGGVAGILTLGAKNTNDAHCNVTTRTCDSQGHDAASSGRLYGAVTTAGLAVGVLGVGLGTYFLVKSGKASENHSALVTQSGVTGAQVSFVQTW